MMRASPRLSQADFTRDEEQTLLVRSLVVRIESRPLLVLAPHPDDEAIGCGGLIAACAAAGVPVFVHYLTDGRHSHPDSVDWPPHRIATAREREAVSAACALGLSDQALRFTRETDGALLFDADAAERAFDAVADHARELGEPVIAAPWRSDPHPDHVAAALIAERLEAENPNCGGLRYIIWSDRDYVSVFPGAQSFDVSAHLHQKLRAIHAYETQTGALIRDCAKPSPMPALRASELHEELYLLSTL